MVVLFVETMNIPTELATMSPDVHVNLTAENLEYISDRIGEQFETKLAAMVSNVVKAIIPEIIPELAKQVNSHLADRLKSLEATNTDLLNRIEALEVEQDRAHQYCRPKSVRVSGISEKAGESTDKLVLYISASIGGNLQLEDIDRSHRVGNHGNSSASNVNRPRDILVKLATYRSRQKP